MHYRLLWSITLVFVLSSCTPGPALPTSEAPIVSATQQVFNKPIRINFDPSIEEDGIFLLGKQDDNQYAFLSKEGKGAISTDGFTSRIRTNYMCFQVSDPFYSKQEPLTVEIEYFDEGEGLILFQYDSSSQQSNEPVYKTIPIGYRQNSKKWVTSTYPITDALFDHRQNFNGDFRLSGELSPLIISYITISRGGVEKTTSKPNPTSETPVDYPQPLGEKAVFTYYFYWYDAPNGTFALTNAPVDYQTMSWRDVSWHLKQIKEIKNAGIDVLLPIYWYTPQDLSWSRPGLVNLAAALEQMRAEGETPPAVGMFVDTSTFLGKDMREESNKQELYDNIKFFFTTIPKGYWALAENERPIVWFYTSNWPTAYDQTFIDFVYEHFQVDFGIRPYLVFENGWSHPEETIDGIRVTNFDAPILKYDASYGWGGAVSPLTSPQITSIGPGYDDHAVEERNPPTYTDRKNGETYKQNFALAIKCGSPWLAIETWSEFMEGTEISETLQYGRQYLDLTKEFTTYFKQGKIPNGLTIGNYGAANKVSFIAGEPNLAEGLSISPSLGDGVYTTIYKEGKSAIQAEEFQDNDGAYLYFSVDNAFYFNIPETVTLSLTYFDEGTSPIFLEYDTLKCASNIDISKMYKRINMVMRQNTLSWKTIDMTISDATFANNQNGGADFRFSAEGVPLVIQSVELHK